MRRYVRCMDDPQPQATPQPTIDPRAFRNALGSFVTGVTIVTTCDAAGRYVGLTANSFNSVSLDPPMILWSLALNSAALDAFRTAEWWAVHILSSDQEDMSSRFARRGEDKFAGLPITAGPGGIPLLDGAAARFICRTAFEYEGGDHAIFVGAVIEFDQATRAPLVYHQGRYGRVLPDMGTSADTSSNDPARFGQHFIGHLLARAHTKMLADVHHQSTSRGLTGADYTVLTALGLGDGCSLTDLAGRAAAAGVENPATTIGSLAARGLLAGEDGLLCLTDAGHRLVVELIAVAQASQIRLEEKLSAGELGVLRNLLGRVLE